MPLTRREMIGASAAALASTALATPHAQSAMNMQGMHPDNHHSGVKDKIQGLPPLSGQLGHHYTPITTTNNTALPWKMVGGAKVYHLVAEPVFHEFTPGLKAHCWGYNGQVPGPTIEAVEGDHVRIYVTNKLPMPTTVHWHGILLPNGMDGVNAITQPSIKPGQTFLYEFNLRQHGTYMYHSHDRSMLQEGMGLDGMFIIHPKQPLQPRIDRDFVILLQEWRIDPGTYRVYPYEMTDFNVFTMNGRCFPGTNPLVVETGQRVRIRFGNLSAMDHHPIHLHGYRFPIVAEDGGDVPKSAQVDHVTALVPVGTTRDIEFVADAPGDWLMHCHMTHHTMNQMGHGLPNMISVTTKGLNQQIGSLLPGYMTMAPEDSGHMMNMPKPPNSVAMESTPAHYGATYMGGMFTILKVRDHLSQQMLANNTDPGWYQQPAGTEAALATAAQLRRDGIALQH